MARVEGDVGLQGGYGADAGPALIVLAGAGLFLLGLGVTALWRPQRAGRFLLAFAATWRVHVLELALRGLVGWAALVAAPVLPGTALVKVVGWVLVATTVLMALLPWRLHRAFAARTVPMALPYLRPIGLCALAGGAGLLWMVLRVRGLLP